MLAGKRKSNGRPTVERNIAKIGAFDVGLNPPVRIYCANDENSSEDP